MNDNQDKNKKQKRNIIMDVVKRDQKSIMKQIKKLLEKKAKIRCQNLSEEQKELKRQYS